MNIFFKLFFLGASLSLCFSSCGDDPNPSAGTEPATELIQETEAVKQAELAIAADIEKEEMKELVDTVQENLESEKRLKEEELKAKALKKKEEASARRKKARREKRRLERERKKKEKAKAEALAQAREKEMNVSEPTPTPTPISTSPSTSPSSGSGSPRIDFREKVYDYGTIQQGEEVRHKFKFKNTGTSELVISNVTVSCGCTQPSYPFIPLAPGEEGYIGVHFKSAGRLGKQKPTITVYTNTEPQTYDLHLQGYVDARRELDPEENDSL